MTRPPNDPKKAGASIVGVGVAACAACCAVPAIGLITASSQAPPSLRSLLAASSSLLSSPASGQRSLHGAPKGDAGELLAPVGGA